MTDDDGRRDPHVPLEPLLSIDEVAELLRISESGVYRCIRRGDLTTVKVGARTLIEPGAIRGFIAAQRRGADRPVTDNSRREAA